MAEILFQKGSFEILSDDVAQLSSKEMNKLVQRCGTISHQSWETTRKTPEEFVKMLYNIGHLSVTEHSWFTFEIYVGYGFSKQDFKLALLEGNHLFCITERPNTIIVSGNARMFIEAYIRNPNIITAGILDLLYKENPILFPLKPSVQYIKTIYPIYLNKPILRTKDEILTHRAMTILFNNCSRGFTHENVRSRNGHNKTVAYTQESTRYVNPREKGGFKFVLPYRYCDLNQKIHLDNQVINIESYISMMEQVYASLIELGLQAQEARQWLPIGIKSQIAQTFNLAEWRHWFLIRTQQAAHPEIRYVACNLLHEIQKRIPEILDDFQFEKKIQNRNIRSI